MKKGKYWLRWSAVFTVFIGCFYSTGLYSSTMVEESTRKRADVIKINFMAAFGELEKPPVEFLHDSHTEVLAKKNKDCTTCHLTENDRMYPKFKRTMDTGRIEVMNIYHEGCISCHGEMKVAQEKTGPVECDDCHNRQDQYLSSRKPMGFDKSLHFRHSEARNNKCEQCHHEYDETKKILFYAKGKEGTCRYCHKDETKDNLISMSLASHMACINCHSKIQAEKQTEKQINPPLKCSGCHDSAAQQKIKKRTPIPRMDRKQPDIVLLGTTPKRTAAGKDINRLDFVPFDHRAHENSNDTCRVCHHESLQSCNECHTLNGSPNGSNGGSNGLNGVKEVTLEKAMHKVGSERSCQGCHDAKKKEENCAGCHAIMGENRDIKDASCIKCHAVPVGKIKGPLNPDFEKSIVKSVLQSKSRLTGTYRKDDIPEKITIKRLSKQYKAVDFPHRKVVKALNNQIKDSKLASYFHDQKGTICQGCHHKSPVSMRPTNCGHCHGKRWDEENLTKPAILGAYHQQCMGCHKQMNIEKPAGCTECHKIKNIE